MATVASKKRREMRELPALVVQRLPVWVGISIKSNLSFPALYSWDEFWETAAAGWAIFGDPRALSDSEWAKWTRETIRPSHRGYFAGMGRSIFLYPAEALNNRIQRGCALYDHAYRVMDWLGFVESTMPMWWLLAFADGHLGRLQIWLPWFKPDIAYWLTEGLRPFRDMVMAQADGRQLTKSIGSTPVFPLPDYDVRDPGRQGKYPQFDPRLLYPRYRRLLGDPSTYVPDPFTAEKLEAIGKTWGEVRNLEKEAKERAEESRKTIREVLKHPMYGLIQLAKFQVSDESRRRLNTIRQLVNECSQGKKPVEDLLRSALEGNPNLMAELAQEKALKGQVSIQKRKQIGDRLYRQVDAWFRRRKMRMPKPNPDWREKIIK